MERTPEEMTSPSPETPEGAAETPAAATEAEATETPAGDAEGVPPAAEAPAESAPAEASTSPPETATNGMADALKGAPATPDAEPKKGQRVKGKIVKIGEDAAFVDFGGREEAALDLREIRDPEGKLTRKVGDEVGGVIASVDGGVKITLKAGKAAPKNLPLLQEAQASGAPVEGKVTSVNKGGLVVHVMGVRGFCPFSQIDRHYVEDPTVFVGKKLSFRVSSADPKGRNVVLSRRALLEEEAKANAEGLRENLEIGKEVAGVVARLRPFGAFIDLGGIDGLLHVSEISHARINDPAQVLKVGQEVKTVVRSLENLGTKDERIGLSMKELQEDPWEAAARSLVVGEKTKAKVVRLADFGAFLELAPGVDGLAHVSTLAEGHVSHPSDVISVGDEVEPWVLSVDQESRRISLSLVEPGAVPAGGQRGGGGGRRGGGSRRDDHDRRPSRYDGPREHKTGPEGPGMTSMQEAFERLRSRMGEED